MISNGMTFCNNSLEGFGIFFNLFPDAEEGCFYIVFLEQIQKLRCIFCRPVVESQCNFPDFCSFIIKTAYEIIQPDIKRSPDNNCKKHQKTKQIYPKRSLKCINKNITENIKQDKRIMFHLLLFINLGFKISMIYIRVVILNGAERNENALANETFSNFIFPNLTVSKTW